VAMWVWRMAHVSDTWRVFLVSPGYQFGWKWIGNRLLCTGGGEAGPMMSSVVTYPGAHDA